MCNQTSYFEAVYGPTTVDADIYTESYKPLLDTLFDGNNATLINYGRPEWVQTSTSKNDETFKTLLTELFNRAGIKKQSGGGYYYARRHNKNAGRWMKDGVQVDIGQPGPPSEAKTPGAIWEPTREDE